MNLAPGRRLLAAALTALCLLPAHLALATISIPSNGDDGSLNITSNTVIDLSNPSIVTTAAWDAATPGIAAYDSTKWAVVFHYTDVNIAAGATLSFINHPKNPPVVWLVSGSVTVAGTLSIVGKAGQSNADEALGGPGGFRGGRGVSTGGASGYGFGPGGGTGGGSFGTTGTNGGGPTYGTPEQIPLIGGSGGSTALNQGAGSGGGGGAILIAAGGDVTVSGLVDASGGAASDYGGAGGSGGGIRIVADRFTSTSAGRLRALGGAGSYHASNGNGGAGRITVTSITGLFLGACDPAYSAPVMTTPPQIWPDSSSPEARVLEIAGMPVPADPSASLAYPRQDLLLSATGDISVRVETRNVPQTSVVSVFVVKSRGTRISPAISAVFESGSTALGYWTATIPAASLTNGSYAIQARAALPQQ